MNFGPVPAVESDAPYPGDLLRLSLSRHRVFSVTISPPARARVMTDARKARAGGDFSTRCPGDVPRGTGCGKRCPACLSRIDNSILASCPAHSLTLISPCGVPRRDDEAHAGEGSPTDRPIDKEKQRPGWGAPSRAHGAERQSRWQVVRNAPTRGASMPPGPLASPWRAVRRLRSAGPSMRASVSGGQWAASDPLKHPVWQRAPASLCGSSLSSLPGRREAALQCGHWRQGLPQAHVVRVGLGKACRTAHNSFGGDPRRTSTRTVPSYSPGRRRRGRLFPRGFAVSVGCV